VNGLYELGNVYARTGDAAAAEAAYRQSLDANAGYDEIYFNVGTLLARRPEAAAAALGFYETSWAINPLFPDLVAALSAAYLREPAAHLEPALLVLREAVRDYPDNPSYWNNYGFALSAAKRYGESEEAYGRALAIDPDLALAAQNLAALAKSTGRPPAPILGALADMRAVDAAIARRDFSDRTLALAASVARRAPDVAKARFVYGSLLLSRGRPKEALPELEAVVARDPGRAAGRINLGSAYQALGRNEDAAAQFRAALADEPGNGAALERLKALGAAP
jgi:tetratricopeptide (TPR) repeat protein